MNNGYLSSYEVTIGPFSSWHSGMVRLHRKKLTETEAETLQVILLGAAKAPIKLGLGWLKQIFNGQKVQHLTSHIPLGNT